MQVPLDPLVADIVNKLDDDLRESFEERAGIIEFDAGLPRAHAECLALLGILINHPSGPLTILYGESKCKPSQHGQSCHCLKTSKQP